MCTKIEALYIAIECVIASEVVNLGTKADVLEQLYEILGTEKAIEEYRRKEEADDD